MLLVPDPATATIDPFHEQPTLSLVCDVRDPVTGEWYSRDPRHVARKAERHLRDTGIADTAVLRPRGRVLHLRPRRLRTGANRGFYEVDSSEGYWNAGAGFATDGERPAAQPRLHEPARSAATSPRRRWTRWPTCAGGWR
jgi:glutamine synthetase